MKAILPFALICSCLHSVPGALLVHEPFDYASDNYDVDAGLNGGNGLPATNDGGDPAGTGVGLRGTTWGGSITAGLTYENLLVSGGALQAATGRGSRVSVYRNMVTDPFVDLRIGQTPSFSDFGSDGTTLWFSFLMRTDTVGDGVRSVLRIGDNFAVEPGIGINAQALSGNNASKFSVDPSTGGFQSGYLISSIDAAPNTTYLVVVRYQFAEAGDEQVDVWINPAIGGEAPTGPGDISYTTELVGWDNFNTRVEGATAVFDEIRVGTSFADVTPVEQDPPPPTHWRGYEIVDGAYVFIAKEGKPSIGWVNITYDPWIWSYTAGKYIYLPDVPTSGGKWGWVVN